MPTQSEDSNVGLLPLDHDPSPVSEMGNANSANMTQRRLSYGEELVGINFNPGGNPKVDRLKAIFAEAADIVKDHRMGDTRETTAARYTVETAVDAQILIAQMMCVKAVTM